MKKISMLFMAAMLSFTVSAQQLTNSDFESWTAGKPTGWSTFSFGAADLCNVTQSTDAHSGSYAVSVQAKGYEELSQIPGIEDLGELGTFFPGFLCNTSADLEGLMTFFESEEIGVSEMQILVNSFGEGLRLTQDPLALNGYLKFDNQEMNDHFLIAVLALAEIDGVRQIVGIGMHSDDPDFAKTAGYQAFSIPISNMSGIPATEIIVFALTAVEDETVNHFTPLLLDDLTLQYASGLEELDLISSVSLFPNPTSGEFRIDVPMGSRVAVSDALGRRVMEINSYNGETLRLDNKGVYFVNIDNRLTKKLIVE